MMRGETQSIVVFDSGVGGISILSSILKLDLGYKIIYLADQDNFPYGDRTQEWLQSRLSQVGAWASTHSPAAFVIACNTASVNSISLVRKELSCPVVGVEPVIKPLAKYKHPLLLATHASLASGRSKDLITKYAPNLATACPAGLVQAIEDLDLKQVRAILDSLSSVIKENQVDAIGLSCTHYPLVKNELQELYPSLSLIDPSQAVAARLATLIPELESSPARVEYYTTADPTKLTTQVQYYLGDLVKAKRLVI